MNAFFASCEQQTQPRLRHKPVAVTPYNGDTGCIISPSYEAKAYGVKTGMLVREAKFRCPNITIIESNVSKYLRFHDKLKKVLFSFSPFVKVMSVDEAAIKLSPSEQNSNKAKTISMAIKQAISEYLGRYMYASIGIGPNIYLAKQAAEFEKPDGLTEIKLRNIIQYLSKIKLTDLSGINRRMEKNLQALDFYKPIDLYQTTAGDLREKIGIAGEYWYLNLHGYDNIQRLEIIEKSIGHSHVLEPKFRNWPLAWAVCQKLIQRAGKRLREAKLTAGGTSLYISYLRGYHYHKALKTMHFRDSFTFTEHIKCLWEKIDKSHKPLKIGVTLFNLTRPWAIQNHLFIEDNKSTKIYNVIDKINDKFGSCTIKPAIILLAENSAPNRIAFGKPLHE